MAPFTSASPWSIPLLGLPGMTALSSSPESLARLVDPFFTTTAIEGLAGDGPFQSTATGLRLGAVDMLAIQGSGLVSKGEGRDGVTLVLPFRQPGDWRVENQAFRVQDNPFVLPSCPYGFRTDQAEGVLLCLRRDALVHVGAAMAGDASDALRHRIEAALQRPELVDLNSGRSRQHLRALHEALWLVDHALRAGEGVSPLLAIDDLILRLSLLLIFPALDASGAGTPIQPLLAEGSEKGSGAERAMHQLIDWILSDLARPLRLTDLELQSGYSRRTLQKQFQDRFGMGPMQWVRRQRLLQARQLIESSGDTLKLGAIARACGYMNAASFSRDFHEVFGQRPSELVRLSRAHPVPEAPDA